MSSEHTPGPWRVGRKVGRTIYCEEAGTDGRLIGVMDRVEDAQLVAAAPEMLEALKMARDELLAPCCFVCGWDPEHRREDDPRTWHSQQGCEIENAIAKANGGER